MYSSWQDAGICRPIHQNFMELLTRYDSYIWSDCEMDTWTLLMLASGWWVNISYNHSLNVSLSSELGSMEIRLTTFNAIVTFSIRWNLLVNPLSPMRKIIINKVLLESKYNSEGLLGEEYLASVLFKLVSKTYGKTCNKLANKIWHQIGNLTLLARNVLL